MSTRAHALFSIAHSLVYGFLWALIFYRMICSLCLSSLNEVLQPTSRKEAKRWTSSFFSLSLSFFFFYSLGSEGKEWLNPKTRNESLVNFSPFLLFVVWQPSSVYRVESVNFDSRARVALELCHQLKFWQSQRIQHSRVMIAWVMSKHGFHKLSSRGWNSQYIFWTCFPITTFLFIFLDSTIRSAIWSMISYVMRLNSGP